MTFRPKIRERSWHHHFWRGSYRILWLTPPERFSICPYFWRVVLFAPLFFYPLGVIGRIAAAPFQLIGWVIRRISDLRPTRTKTEQPATVSSVQRSSSSRIHRRIYSAALVLYLGTMGAMAIIFAITQPLKFFLMVGAVAAMVIAVMAVFLLLRGCHALARSDSSRLVRDFLRAKKERLCPFVEVISENATYPMAN